MKVTDLSAKAHGVLSKAFCSVMIAVAVVAGFSSCQKEVNVTDVSLNKSTLQMTVGDVEQLTATVFPTDADDKSVTWNSNNPSVATVDNNGNVTAVSAGEAIITVTSNDVGKSATCKVTVSFKVTCVSLNKTSLSLEVGNVEQLMATVSPSNATNKSVTWNSNNPSVASVDNNGNVTAVTIGTATITVTTQDGGKTEICNVTVISAGEYGVVIDGVRWATRNVDAPGTFAASPESAGMFYQWNRKKGWASTGIVSDWDNSLPDGTTWEKANDPSPSGWRVPTYAEIQSLVNTSKVTLTWTIQNSIGGIKFTDKNTGKFIFLPAAGFRESGDKVDFVGTGLRYWSSTQHSDDGSYVLDRGGYVSFAAYGKYFGLSIRPVAE
jgi:uncharacterized protein (TIGR02145 family)